MNTQVPAIPGEVGSTAAPARNRDWLDSCALALLTVQAATLPFEMKTPLAAIGPVVITNTELFLYAVIGVWAVMRLARRPTHLTIVHGPLLVLILVLITSALLASEMRGDAMKFAARSIGGCLLAMAAIDIVTTRREAVVVIAALAGGSLLSALLGIVEVEAPGMQPWLMSFKTQPTFASGFLRVSGTFQYANTAAMYWEASLPLVLGLAVPFRTRWAGRSGWWLGLAAVGALSAALVASASRAGLAGAVITLLWLAWAGGRKHRALRALALASLALLLWVFVAHGLRTGLLALRLRTSDTSEWHRAVWLSTPAQLEVRQGALTRTTVRLRNTGVLPWTASGDQPVHVSYHWMHERGGYRVFDGARTPLPRDIAPGEELTIEAFVFGNVAPGDHELQWDLVREGVTWFSAEGGPTTVTRARVMASTQPTVLPPNLRRLTVRPELRPARTVLWRAAWRMWLDHPVMGIGPDNFRHRYGAYAKLDTFDDRITANSLYLEILSTLGLAGVAVWTWLIAALAVAARRWWRHTPAEAAATGIVLAASLIAFLVHGALDYFLAFTPTYGLFWLLVGLATRTWTHGREEDAA